MARIRSIFIIGIFIFNCCFFATNCDCDSVKNYHGYKVVDVVPNSITDLHFIKRLTKRQGLEFLALKNQVGHTSTVLIEPSVEKHALHYLKKYKLAHEVVIDNVQRVIEKERELNKHENHDFTKGITFDKYYNVEEINNYLTNLTKKYPDLTEIVTIGKSFEGRDLNVLKISTGGNDPKPAVLIDGGIHAREWIAPAQALFIIHQLVENATAYQDLIDNLDIYVMPVVNPDGYEFTFTHNRLWRKTRSTNPNSSCKGVDANRNWDIHWNEVAPNSNPCSIMYPGRAPFSENETMSVANFTLSIKDQLKFYLNMHSFGKMILYPWGFTKKKPDNDAVLNKLGQRANKALNNEYKVGPIYTTIYPAAGSTVDWFKAVAGVELAYGMELPKGGQHGFDPPPAKIEGIVTETFKGILVFIQYVSDNYV